CQADRPRRPGETARRTAAAARLILTGWMRLLKSSAEILKESRSDGSIGETVIDGEGCLDQLADRELSLVDRRLRTGRSDGKYRRLGRIDDSDEMVRSLLAEVGHRQRSAGQLLRRQLPI